jgi:hypothetical protein
MFISHRPGETGAVILPKIRPGHTQGLNLALTGLTEVCLLFCIAIQSQNYTKIEDSQICDTLFFMILATSEYFTIFDL